MLTGGTTIANKIGQERNWMPTQTFIEDPCIENGNIKEVCNDREKYGLAFDAVPRNTE